MFSECRCKFYYSQYTYSYREIFEQIYSSPNSITYEVIYRRIANKLCGMVSVGIYADMKVIIITIWSDVLMYRWNRSNSKQLRNGAMYFLIDNPLLNCAYKTFWFCNFTILEIRSVFRDKIDWLWFYSLYKTLQKVRKIHFGPYCYINHTS